MIEWIVSNFWTTGGIVIALIFIAHRVISDEKLNAWGFKIGVSISSLGRSKLGKGNWEKLETEFLSWTGAFLAGLAKGLATDNSNNNDKPKEKA